MALVLPWACVLIQSVAITLISLRQWAGIRREVLLSSGISEESLDEVARKRSDMLVFSMALVVFGLFLGLLISFFDCRVALLMIVGVMFLSMVFVSLRSQLLPLLKAVSGF